MPAQRYRKKPVTIEAEQYIPTDDPLDVPLGVCVLLKTGHRSEPHIHTLEGEMVVSPGDWVITGVKGERYPCKPDIFEATYEPAPQATGDDGRAA